MAEFTVELIRIVPALFAGAVLVQGETIDDRFEKLDRMMEAEQSSSVLDIPIGAIIAGGIISLALQILFGFWGKQAAEQHGIHPAIGFTMGFLFYWIGVKMVPVFRKDRLLVQVPARYNQPPMHAPNPMYSPPPQAYAPPPVPQPPPQAPPPKMLIADPGGYVDCPGCGSRTKAGRKTCMNCGFALPAVYNPHIK